MYIWERAIKGKEDEARIYEMHRSDRTDHITAIGSPSDGIGSSLDSPAPDIQAPSSTVPIRTSSIIAAEHHELDITINRPFAEILAFSKANTGGIYLSHFFVSSGCC